MVQCFWRYAIFFPPYSLPLIYGIIITIGPIRKPFLSKEIFTLQQFRCIISWDLCSDWSKQYKGSDIGTFGFRGGSVDVDVRLTSVLRGFLYTDAIVAFCHIMD